MPQRLFRIFLPAVMLILSAGACYFVEDMGELHVDRPPVSFTIHGDTEQSWGVKVTPGARYEITLIALEPIKTPDMQFHVSTMRSNCPDQKCLASAYQSLHGNGEFTLTFVAPNVHKVYVVVYWVIDSGNFGTATIQVHHLDRDASP